MKIEWIHKPWGAYGTGPIYALNVTPRHAEDPPDVRWVVDASHRNEVGEGHEASIDEAIAAAEQWCQGHALQLAAAIGLRVVEAEPEADVAELVAHLSGLLASDRPAMLSHLMLRTLIDALTIRSETPQQDAVPEGDVAVVLDELTDWARANACCSFSLTDAGHEAVEGGGE